MATVNSVLGPLDAAELGPTLVHEHIYFSYPGDVLDPNDKWSRARCIDTAVERVRQLMDFGIKTVVDPTPIEMGRDAELLAEVSRASGMQIVCATGFYVEHIGIPYYWRVRAVEEIAELFTSEITDGIGDTGIKPGIIKIASSDPPTELEKKVIEAAATVAAENGVTVISHCENSSGWDVQQDILEIHGVDLSRCLIGHQDHAKESKQLARIADRGSFAGIDRIGIEILRPDPDRVGLIVDLVEGGYADRVCLSQDHFCCLRSVKFPYPGPSDMQAPFKEALPTLYEQLAGRPHTYLFTDFWPRLSEAGIDRSVFDSMLLDNPRRLFGG